MSATQHHPPSDAIAVDYAVTGPRSAAGVARGETRLIGMSYYDGIRVGGFLRDGIAVFVHFLGMRRRIYDDSLFSRAIELFNDIPLGSHFDDLNVMQRLLGTPPSEAVLPTSPGPEAPFNRASSVLWLHQRLAPQLRTAGLRSCYEQLELPIIDPTLAMVANGVRVRLAKLEQHVESIAARMETARRQLAEVAGRHINLDSDDELRRLLFGERRPQITGPVRSSTRVSFLEQFIDHDPAVAPILQYKRSKPVHAAAVSLLRYADRANSLVHPELNPLGAVTGRFGCANPPLQGLASAVLDAVVATPGAKLMLADVSQCEPRVLAHVSQDRLLLETFARDGDVYRVATAAALGIREEDVTRQQRETIGKRLFLAISYGQGAGGLAEALDMHPRAAQEVLDRFFAEHAGVAQWIANAVHSARERGEVRTLSGRRRLLPGLYSSWPGEVAAAERRVVNTIIQGTAADLMKWMIIRLHRALPPSVRLLLTIHDAVLLEVPEDLVEDVRQIVLEVMQTPPANFTVPLKVNVTVGDSWLECKS